MLASTIQALLLTLLFLTAAGLRRTWDLRSYTGSMLALLNGRLLAYGYRHTERFLTEVAQAGGAEPLTDALARWTVHLWLPPASQTDTALVTVYIDGHRKPVYTDARIPRGLIGRTGAIAGCRALILLHDAAGHPLLVTTERGDTHLTVGLPQILTRFEQALLPGTIVWGEDSVEVSLCPFNDRQLNRALGALCMRVAAAAPHLPDGRRLLFTIGAAHRLNLDVSPH